MERRSVAPSVHEVLPVRREHDRREDKAEDHVDDRAGAEGDEGLFAGPGQTAEPSRQADAEKAENESSGAKVLDRSNQSRHSQLVVIGKAVAAGHRRY